MSDQGPCGSDDHTRPTPAEIERAVLDQAAECNLEPCVLEAIVEHNYVIVHPDDHPRKHLADPPYQGMAMWWWSSGYNAALNDIFGATDED